MNAGRILPESAEDLKIVQCILQDDRGSILSECEALYTLPKYFPFREPKIRILCEGKKISLESDTFCTGVELQAGSIRFSDNWITLYPGEARTLTADREPDADELRVLWLE